MRSFLLYFFDFVLIITANHIARLDNFITIFMVLTYFGIGFALFKIYSDPIEVFNRFHFLRLFFVISIIEIIVPFICAFIGLSFELLYIKFNIKKKAQKILKESEFFLQRIEEDKKTIEEIELNILQAKERIEYLEEFFKKDIEFLKKQDENFDKILDKDDPVTKNKILLLRKNSYPVIMVFKGKDIDIKASEIVTFEPERKVYEKNDELCDCDSYKTEYRIDFYDDFVEYFKNIVYAPNKTKFSQKFYQRRYSNNPANELITFQDNFEHWPQNNFEKSNYTIQYCADDLNHIYYEKNADESYLFKNNYLEIYQKRNQGPTIYNREKFEDIYFFKNSENKFITFKRNIPVEHNDAKVTFKIMYNVIHGLLLSCDKFKEQKNEI